MKEDRRKGVSLKTLIIVATLALLVGVFITARFDVTQEIKAESFWKENGTEEPITGTLPSFADLAEKLAPSVVNISTTHTVKGRKAMPFNDFKGSPFEDFFGDDFFEKFFGGEMSEMKRQSLGSGFIINKDGYILTNNHVIENATEIIVTFSEEKKEFTAEVIGSDKKLDLALIKIETNKDLPVAVLGNSDKLRVGEWVIAIGNPFGLGGTVTAGIVSQKGRAIGAGPYDDFIQTDASINPGNSGGPLFNLSGEVVGINTAIIAGGQGIGFATPVNIIKDVLVQLKDEGHITRGWIGVSIQELTPELSAHFGLEEGKGALISGVTPNDPAEKAGVKAGDIIIEFNGNAINEVGDLPRSVAVVKPGATVGLKLLRDGKVLNFDLTVVKRDDDKRASMVKTEKETIPQEKLGITVTDITPSVAERLGLKDTETGVVISEVKRGSPAGFAGLRTGDIIKEINKKRVTDIRDYKDAMADFKAGKSLLLLISRGGSSFYLTIEIKE